MDPIETYVLQFRRDGIEVFLGRHDVPILVVKTKRGEEDGWGAFHTDTFSFDRGSIAEKWSDEEVRATERAEGLAVLKITKSPNNPWRSRISLGRATNNDMVVQDSSVSKLHAHFSASETGVLQLTDAGSHNGTSINGNRLERGIPSALREGDVLLFGDVEAVFHSPDSFASFIESLFGS